MLDTKGPEIRTGKLKDKQEIDLVVGQIIKVSSDPNTIVCFYHNIVEISTYITFIEK